MSYQQAKRIQYIDRLRGLAVVAMFFVHSMKPWMTEAARDGRYYKFLGVVSGMVAPVFLFLAGLSIAIIAKRGRERGADTLGLKRRVAWRGLQIWLIGYGFHIFSFVLNGGHGDWLRMFKVDILHCIGASMVVLPWIAWPRRRFNLPALVYVLAVPLLSMILFRLPVEAVLPAGISGYFKTDAPITQFSFIPYSTWIAFGMLIGPWWAETVASRAERRFWIRLALVAVLLYGASQGGRWVFHRFDLAALGTDTPQVRGLPHFFWLKGAYVLALLLASRAAAFVLDRPKVAVLVLFGQTSLFGYCLHLYLIYDVFCPHLHHRLTATGHFAAGIALTVIVYLLSRVWRRLLPGVKHWWASRRPKPEQE